MKKEKLIFIFFIIIIVTTSLETLPIMIPSIKGLRQSEETSQASILNKQDSTNLGSENTIPLNISGWGTDIFHDRSNVYDSWFQLTGITEFQNEYKAIVNGEILQANDRVRGFTVNKITKDRVVLKRNEYRVTLKLEN